MQAVTAHIDITRPAGRKLVRELESKRCVIIQYPQEQRVNEKKYTLREVFEKGERMLNEHFDTDLKLTY
jgi:hypothetical protein